MVFIYKNDPIKPLGSNFYQKPASLEDNIKGSIFHKNYLSYLSGAYATHYGIVVRPDHIWYTILCEMGYLIKSDPKKYESLFTNSSEKKDISVPTLDPIVMPIDSLINELFKLIPSGLNRDVILLNFSTTDAPATFAFSTSFLDAASPYYNYSMYLCGFNKIKVLGNVTDYELMRTKVGTLSFIFNSTPVDTYLTKVHAVIQSIIDEFNDEKFWQEMFYIEHCGSGHQEEAKGWFTDLYHTYPRLGYVCNFPTHLSIVEYKNITTGKSFVMKSGLLSSVIEDDYMIPNFEFYVNEKTEEVPQSPRQRA